MTSPLKGKWQTGLVLGRGRKVSCKSSLVPVRGLEKVHPRICLVGAMCDRGERPSVMGVSSTGFVSTNTQHAGRSHRELMSSTRCHKYTPVNVAMRTVLRCSEQRVDLTLFLSKFETW